jgi:heat shock protein HtpX
MPGRRRDLFPPDRRLQACMAVVLVLDAVFTVAAVAGLVWITLDGGFGIVVLILMFSLGGAATSIRSDRRSEDAVTHEQRERATAVVQRLCVVGALPQPRVLVVPDDLPQSWTVAFPFGRPRIKVSTGLLAVVDDRELEAVLAHELSHIAQGDAVVMTLASAPGIWVIGGLRQAFRSERRSDPIKAWLGLPMALLLGVMAAPWALIGSLLSRFRELTADEGAARLTGSPAAVSAALVALSDDLAGRRAQDLRAAVAPDVLNILPLRAAHGVGRAWATHPPLQRRLAALDRMEGRLQHPAPAAASAV